MTYQAIKSRITNYETKLSSAIKPKWKLINAKVKSSFQATKSLFVSDEKKSNESIKNKSDFLLRNLEPTEKNKELTQKFDFKYTHLWLHHILSDTKFIKWTYSIISPKFIPINQSIKSYPSLLFVINYINSCDRVYFLIYFFEILILILFIKFIYMIFFSNNNKLNSFNQFLNELDINRIKYIDHIDGYDDEIFILSENPEKNPSIYSKEYVDLGAPKHFSDYDKAKIAAEKIYKVLDNCKDCLGGAGLMLFASSKANPETKDHFDLYTPLHFGFIRNQSSKSLFNLVKTGKISMETLSVHSPAVTTLVNNTDQRIEVNIPKGTIFEGKTSNQFPLETTDHTYVTLPPKGNMKVQLNQCPLTFPSGFKPFDDIRNFHCYQCWLGRYYNQISGDYLLTSFFIPHQPDKSPKNEPPKTNSPKNESKKVETPENKQEYDPSKHCGIDPSCDIWKEKLKNKKIKRGCIVRRPLEGIYEKRPFEHLDVLIHEGVVFETEDGDFYLVEKMAPENTGSSSSKKVKNPNGAIITRPCRVKGKNVFADTDWLTINHNWKEPEEPLNGAKIYEHCQNDPPYSLFEHNCQEFAHKAFPEFHFYPNIHTKSTLKYGGFLELIGHTLFK